MSEPLPLRKSRPTKLSISCFAPISRHASISKSSSLPSFSVDEPDGGLIAKKRMSGKPDFRRRALSSSSLWAQLKRNNENKNRERRRSVNFSRSSRRLAYMTA